MLSKILNKLKPHVVGIKFVDDTAIIEYKPPTNWEFIETELFEWSPYPDDPETLIIYSVSPDASLDELIQYVTDVITFNKENEAKLSLLSEKIDQLKSVFEDLTVDECKTLDFTWKKKRGRRPSSKTPPIEFPEPREPKYYTEETGTTTIKDNQRRGATDTTAEESIKTETELVDDIDSSTFLTTEQL